MSTYTPNAGSLADRLCVYFTRHPEEELSTQDIAIKFEVSANNVTALLTRAVETKLLDKRRTKSQNVVYGAGPRLQGYRSPAEAVPTTPGGALQAVFSQPAAPRSEPARTRTNRALPPLDIDALVIETGIPVQDVRPRARIYEQMFEKLGVDQSTLLPIEYRGAITKAAQDYTKQHGCTFAVRKVSETQIRLYRTK